MSDGRTSTNSSPFGLPLPVSLAAVVAILGFIGLRVPGLKSPEPKDGSASQAEAAVRGVAYDGHSPAIKVLSEAFGMQGAVSTIGQSVPSGQAGTRSQPLPTDYAAELTQIMAAEAVDPADRPFLSQCLIACLPDPNDSHFPMSFDNGLESIVRAFQKHGYVRDRHEMVWQNDLRSIRGGTQNIDARVAHDRASAVLFRRTSRAESDSKRSRDEYAMLLLVGETPTTGVHPRALHDAMNFVHALKAIQRERSAASGGDELPADSGPASPDFRILGPTYSGSSSGLRRAIDQWQAMGPRGPDSDRGLYVRVISGSATSKSNQDIFSRNHELKSMSVDYSATVATDDIILDDVLKDFVNNRGVQPYQIAILSETDTSYGSELIPGSNSRSVRPNGQQSLAGVRRLRYPMTMSRMRNEYWRRGSLNEQVGSQPEVIKRRNLDLSLDVSPYSIDILPSFSPSSAAVAELVLENVLGVIQSDDIRVLGILGTDVTDKLFLAQQVRKRCPDVQLFTLESDFLFTHATYAPSLRGMIVASSYPLYPRTQSWSLVLKEAGSNRGGHTDAQFASDTSQGIYNAAVQLLNSGIQADATNQPRLDFGRVFSAEVSDDSIQAKDPPYGWLTMVGDTELLPLRQLDNDLITPVISETSVYGLHHWVRTPPRLPMGVTMLSAIALGLVIWFWNFSTISDANRKLGTSSWIREFFRGTRVFRQEDRRHSCFESFRRGYIVTAFLLGIALILGAISFAPLVHLIGFGLARDFAPITQSWRQFAAVNWLVFLGWSFTFTLLLSCMLLALLRPQWFDQLASGWSRRRRHDSDAGSRLGHDGEGRLGSLRMVCCLLASSVLYIVILTCGWLLLSRYGNTSLLSGEKAWFAIQISRTGNLSNLVNPTVPILLLGGIIAIWAYCSLKRLQLVDDYGLSNPLVAATAPVSQIDPSLEYAGQLPGIRRTSDEIRNSICQPFWRDVRFTDLVAGAVIAIALHRALSSRWVGTYEGWTYDLTVKVLLLIAFSFVAAFVFRVHKLLRSADRMLSRVGHLPLADAFSRLPEAVKSKAAGQLSCLRPDQGDVDGMLRKYDALFELPHEAARGLGFSPQKFATLSEDAQALLAERCEALAAGTGSGYVFAETRLAEKLAESTARLLVPPLLAHWQSRQDARHASHRDVACQPEAVECSGEQLPARWQSMNLIDRNAEVLVAAVSHVDLNRQSLPTSERPVPASINVSDWYREVEELIAMQLAYQIRVIFLHARNLLIGNTLMILLLFWAVNCYPFQPGTLLNFSCLVILIWLLAITFGGILRFNRNEILSRIGGTKPNQLTFDSSFWTPIVSYIGLPILAVLATLMPTVGRTLFGWTSTVGQMFSSGGN